MSQQNDEDNIFDLINAAQQQQKAVEDAIVGLNKLKDEIKALTVLQAHKTVSEALTVSFKDGTKQISSIVENGEELNQRLWNTIDKFNFRLALVGIAIASAFFLGIILVSMWYVPSLDEINQRRAEQKVLNQYGVQISQAVDGAKVVKIMSKKCYSSKETPKVYDWCVIDPKKY